jgi:hypothetical protein
MYVADVDNHESAVASALPIARALAPRSPSLLALETSILDGRVPQRAGLERAIRGRDRAGSEREHPGHLSNSTIDHR